MAPDVPRVEGERIAFSDTFAKRIGLETAEVRLGPLTPVISVVGTVALDPEHLAAVGTRLRGLVRSMHKFEGDDVKKGELLAEIDSAELGEAQASVRMLGAQRDAAKMNAEREQQLLERQLSTAREAEVAMAELKKYDALQKAAQQRVRALSGQSGEGNPALGRYSLRSPIDGTIIDRGISTGQSVEADLVAFRRELHRFPEISGEEEETARRVVEFLADTGPSELVTGLGGHGVAAVYDSGLPGPTVLFRSELDALPIEELSDAPHRSTVAAASPARSPHRQWRGTLLGHPSFFPAWQSARKRRKDFHRNDPTTRAEKPSDPIHRGF